MIVYKVCHFDGKRYLSAFMGTMGSTMRFTLEYKEGEKTEAEFGKIFIFDNIADARHWALTANLIEPLVIFQCEAKRPSKLRRKIFNCSIEISQYAQEWWRKAKFSIPPDGLVPSGTLICKEVLVVELLEKVQR